MSPARVKGRRDYRTELGSAPAVTRRSEDISVGAFYGVNRWAVL